MNPDLLRDMLRRGDAPDAALVRALVADARSRQTILAEARVRDALARLAARRSGVRCAVVSDDLAALIDAEREGEDVQRLYGAAWAHVEQCAVCYEQYTLVRAVIALQASDDLPRWTLPLPVASLPLPRSEIQRVLAMHARPTTLRGAADHQYLVYDGAMPGRAGMFVEVTLVATADEWSIVVALHGSGAGPNLAVGIRCRDDARSALTDAQGEARFDVIPRAWIEDATADLLLSVA